MPDLVAVADRYDDVELITVLVSPKQSFAMRVVADLEHDIPVLLDDGSLRSLFRINKVPWTFVIDVNGNARSSMLGRRTIEQLEKALAKVR